MTALDAYFAADRPAPSGRITVAGAPEGHDAFVLGDLARRGTSVLHICRDDGRMARTAAALAFFHPSVEAIALPAWDCLPYDRVSPNAEIMSRRIDALTRLVEKPPSGQSRIVLTTVNAAIQRVPPRHAFRDRVLRLGRGGRIPLDRLIGFLGKNGYSRTDTVREAGEFAVRGGIVDLFPSGAPAPVRLDFFGDDAGGGATLRRAHPALDRHARRRRAEAGQRGAARRRRRSSAFARAIASSSAPLPMTIRSMRR